MIYEQPSIYKQGLGINDLMQAISSEWENLEIEILSNSVTDYQFFHAEKNKILAQICLNCYFTVNMSDLPTNSWSPELIRIKNVKLGSPWLFAQKLSAGGTPENKIIQVGNTDNPDARIKLFKTDETGLKAIALNTVILNYTEI